MQANSTAISNCITIQNAPCTEMCNHKTCMSYRWVKTQLRWRRKVWLPQELLDSKTLNQLPPITSLLKRRYCAGWGCSLQRWFCGLSLTIFFICNTLRRRMSWPYSFKSLSLAYQVQAARKQQLTSQWHLIFKFSQPTNVTALRLMMNHAIEQSHSRYNTCMYKSFSHLSHLYMCGITSHWQTIPFFIHYSYSVHYFVTLLVICHVPFTIGQLLSENNIFTRIFHEIVWYLHFKVIVKMIAAQWKYH